MAKKTLYNKPTYPLNDIQKVTNQFPTSLSQSYTSLAIKGVEDAYNISVSYEEYNKILLESKDYYKDKEVDTKQKKQSYKNTVDYNLTTSYYNQKIKEPYKTDYAIWLPSKSPSKTASIEHIANYGEIFKINEGINGDYPSKRKNCKCGLRILDSKELEEYNNAKK